MPRRDNRNRHIFITSVRCPLVRGVKIGQSHFWTEGLPSCATHAMCDGHAKAGVRGLQVKATDSVQVEAITIDDMASTNFMRALAGSLVAGAIFWGAALAVVLY